MKTLEEISENRINNITFLRLIAALAVIYGHSYAIVQSGGQDWVARITGYAHAGGVAVDFFFLLSGFLVTSSIINRGLVSYIISRTLRLFPALWIYLLIIIFFIGPIFSNLPVSDYFESQQTWKYLISIGTGYSTEWFLPGLFENNRSKGVNGSIWSVIVEIRMYLYLALFYLLGFFRSKIIFNFTLSFLVIAVWSDSFSVPGISGSTDKHVALLFCIGSALYINRSQVVITPLYFILAFALSGATYKTNGFQFGYILLLVGFFIATAFMSGMNWIDKLGDYSYGVYLYGWPVQQLMATIFPAESAIFNALSSMLLSLLLACASWHLIEKKALNFKNPAVRFVKNVFSTLGLR
jgi:peptidoglycan/LPS O-acetylase OafA/YrhL